jgi:hypothetical protein
VAQRLCVEAGDPVIKVLFDRVFDHLISPDGPLKILASDLVVHVESLTAGIVVTHRLSDAEHRSGVLAAGVDLAWFRSRTELKPTDGAGTITVTEHEWARPDGWLAGVPAGALLAMRVEDDVVTITPLDDDPAVASELVALIARSRRRGRRDWAAGSRRDTCARCPAARPRRVRGTHRGAVRAARRR